MKQKPPCDYGSCGNRAAWKVAYTTPDDGKTMRHVKHALRCYWHADEPKFFPKGASRITRLGSWDVVVMRPLEPMWRQDD